MSMENLIQADSLFGSDAASFVRWYREHGGVLLSDEALIRMYYNGDGPLTGNSDISVADIDRSVQEYRDTREFAMYEFSDAEYLATDALDEKIRDALAERNAVILDGGSVLLKR